MRASILNPPAELSSRFVLVQATLLPLPAVVCPPEVLQSPQDRKCRSARLQRAAAQQHLVPLEAPGERCQCCLAVWDCRHSAVARSGIHSQAECSPPKHMLLSFDLSLAIVVCLLMGVWAMQVVDDKQVLRKFAFALQANSKRETQN